MAAIAEFGFVTRVWPSEANFFLIRVSDADALMEHCANQKILLRNFTGDLSECIRITVGARSENDTLLDVFDQFGKD